MSEWFGGDEGAAVFSWFGRTVGPALSEFGTVEVNCAPPQV